jgi:hypothetical protein
MMMEAPSRNLRGMRMHLPRGQVLLKGYLFIGAALSLVMWSSFTLPVLFSMAPSSFGEHTIALLAVQPAAVLSAVMRLALWGPSLVLWVLAPTEYAFGMWLAPGFYAGPAFPNG